MITHWLNHNYSETKWAKPFMILLWVEWTLLCISILTTKQHYMFALFSGMFVGYFAWRFFQPTLDKIQSSDVDSILEEVGWSN